MGMQLSPVRACVGFGLCVAVGCGLRSDPLFVADTDPSQDTQTGTDTEPATDSAESSSGDSDSDDFPPPEEGRVGSCTNPIELPTTDSMAMGELRGPGLYSTECAEAGGLEDVYVFRPTTATDVTLTFDPAQTDFDPIVRVSEFACGPDGVVLRQCTDGWIGGGVADPRHFVAIGNRDFYFQIDSNGTGGNYAFDVSLGPVPTAECDVHPETIVQNLGSRFLWANDFTGGQGSADSLCGGVGKENFFPLQMNQPGLVSITATGTDGFRPVLSVRTDCSALTELGCTSDQILGTPGFGFLEVFIDQPGTYYLSVDTLSLEPGGFELDVEFG